VGVIGPPAASALITWHDLECGHYRADLRLWRRLARAADTPVLDVGAGTGRVSLDLARRGVKMIAVDREPLLLDELARRARGLPVRCYAADARELDLPESGLDLCLVPMQTVQLLGGAGGRARFLRAARGLVRGGGLLACAISENPEPFDAAAGPAPAPDCARQGTLRYLSHPTAVRVRGGRAVLERRREIHRGGRLIDSAVDVIKLDLLSAAQLEREAAAFGWRAQAAARLEPTAEHVGSTVVMLRA
jgi:SAM-dependent methyltransferase